jgi:hypothetical protein
MKKISPGPMQQHSPELILSLAERARNDLRYSRYPSLHTYTQTFAYAQALHNRYRPSLDR